MKRVLIVIMALIITIFPIVVSTAQPRYNAEFTFNVTINGKFVNSSKKVYLYSGDKINISLNLKSGEDYFLGPFATKIFYSDNIKFDSFNWNKSGRFYTSCKSYSNFKNNDVFFKVDMIPTSVDAKQAVENVNESLLNINLTASGKRDDKAKIFIDSSTVRSTANPFGETYLACYTENGNFSGKRYDYGEGMVLNFDKAFADFIITDAGDVNSDDKRNSVDALSIIQYATGIIKYTESQKKAADVNNDNKVNSGDGLAVLQIATGLLTINDILNK